MSLYNLTQKALIAELRKLDNPDRWIVVGIRNGRVLVAEVAPYWGA